MRKIAGLLASLCTATSGAHAQQQQQQQNQPQRTAIQRLTADDWHVRNDAARELLAATEKESDIAALLTVLEQDWDWAPDTPTRPRAEDERIRLPRGKSGDPVLSHAFTQTISASNVYCRRPRFAPNDASDLDVPAHAHDLAAMVLRHRYRDDLEFAELRFAPTTLGRASAWLLSKRPTTKAIAARIVAEGAEHHLAQALWCQGGAFREQLHELLQHDDEHVRSAAIGTLNTGLLDRPEGYTKVLDQALYALGGTARANACVLLLIHEDKRLLATRLAQVLPSMGRSKRRRALALLTVLGEHAKPAFAVLCDAFSDAMRNRRYALRTMCQLDLSRAQRLEALSQAMPLLDHRDDQTQTLAFDLLAKHSGDLQPSPITALQRMVSAAEPPPIASRVLGLLHRMNAIPSEMSTADKAALAGAKLETLDTWLATLDEGRKGAVALIPALERQVWTEPRKQVVALLGRKHQALMHEWLQHPSMCIRGAALWSMKDVDNPHVPTKELVDLLQNQRLSTRVVLDRLEQRQDAHAYAEHITKHLLTSGETSQLNYYIKRVTLPARIKLSVFDTALRHGIGWQALQSMTHEEQLVEWRRLWEPQAAEDTRIAMLQTLCTIGPETDAEVQLILGYLQQQRYGRQKLYNALTACPHWPRKLRDGLRNLRDTATPGTPIRSTIERALRYAAEIR
ncbi:MAG: hypothetical protein AB8H80_06515 [Planctomycetota bacterium]